jgi:DNA-binding beta-propeller fold protein YncE
VTTIAGGPSFGSKDGPGAQALFYYPAGLALDGAGNLYIADSYNHSIRKWNISSGNVTTVAGTGKSGVVNGPLLQAQFDSPTGLAIDKNGDLYVSEAATIRKIILP